MENLNDDDEKFNCWEVNWRDEKFEEEWKFSSISIWVVEGENLVGPGLKKFKIKNLNSLNFHSRKIHFKSLMSCLATSSFILCLKIHSECTTAERKREREKINKTILNVFLIENLLIVIVSRQSNKVFSSSFCRFPFHTQQQRTKVSPYFFLLQKENFLRYRFFSLLFAILFILFSLPFFSVRRSKEKGWNDSSSIEWVSEWERNFLIQQMLVVYKSREWCMAWLEQK